MLAGHQVLGRSGPGLIMRRSAADHITRLLLLTAHTRMQFIIARKTWSLRFVCAATTEAPHMARQYRPTRRNAEDCTVTLRSHLTEQSIFPITAALELGPLSFRKTTVSRGMCVPSKTQAARRALTQIFRTRRSASTVPVGSILRCPAARELAALLVVPTRSWRHPPTAAR